MQVRLNTDNHIEGGGRKDSYWSEIAHDKLKRFEDHISALEIHVADHNSGSRQGAADKECNIEARLNGFANHATTCKADSVEKAISGALDKMKNALEHTFDKIKTH